MDALSHRHREGGAYSSGITATERLDDVAGMALEARVGEIRVCERALEPAALDRSQELL
jgi:hypothetical protein